MDSVPSSPSCSAAQARVEIRSGSRRDAVVCLDRYGAWLLGCGDDCGIRFLPGREPFVSRRHARLTLEPDGATLEDLGSSNGTCLNGQPLTHPSRLFCGDTIELGAGGPLLQFYAEGGAYERNMEGRGTVVIRRPPAARERQTDDIPPRRAAISKALLACAMLVLAVLLARQIGDNRQHRQELDGLREELAEVRQAAEDGDAVSRRLGEQYGDGIFLIALRVCREGFAIRGQQVPVGHLQPGGTAWAIDRRGILATNAHVHEYSQQLLHTHAPNLELVAVQNGTGRVFSVIDGRSHPGFGSSDAGTRFASDVALLSIDAPVETVLPLADPEVCASLGQGDWVCSIGFPIQQEKGMRLFYGYDSPDKVLATMRHGWIQRLTGPDGARADPAHARLVHVGLPAVGGQSGSPVLDREGRVVALLIAVGMYQIAGTDQRLPHPGMFTYSVRVDALHELLAMPVDESPVEMPPLPQNTPDADSEGLTP